MGLREAVLGEVFVSLAWRYHTLLEPRLMDPVLKELCLQTDASTVSYSRATKPRRLDVHRCSVKQLDPRLICPAFHLEIPVRGLHLSGEMQSSGRWLGGSAKLTS